MSATRNRSRRKPAPRAREPRTKPRRPLCGRCHHRVARVVPAYWDPTYRICPSCCAQLDAHHHATDTWPTPRKEPSR
jgi:hypothetical protein